LIFKIWVFAKTSKEQPVICVPMLFIHTMLPEEFFKGDSKWLLEI
jgi:hypothetical protein